MSIKALLTPFLFAVLPLTAHAGPGSVSIGYIGGGCNQGAYHSKPQCAHVHQRQICQAYNRDGVTCAQVGFVDGQLGAPWGDTAGYFLCTNGCLQWLGYDVPQQQP